MSIQQPIVSVITCFYNEERFLEETVKSVLGQTLTAWELILVDDGSSDASTALAKDYAQRYPNKIIYLEHDGHTNKGLSASRNHGIKHAKGRFIAYLDADDVWLPHKLEQQVSIFNINPTATVILEASTYWYSWESADRKDVIIAIGAPAEQMYSPPTLMLVLYPLSQGAAPCPSGIMVRREVHDRILFEESFRGIYQMYEDQGFLSKVYLHEHVYVSSACNNLYRQRAASLVSSVHATGKYATVRRYYLEWFECYLQEKQINIDIVNKRLKNAFIPYRQPTRYLLTIFLPALVKRKITGAKRRLRKLFGQ